MCIRDRWNVLRHTASNRWCGRIKKWKPRKRTKEVSIACVAHKHNSKPKGEHRICSHKQSSVLCEYAFDTNTLMWLEFISWVWKPLIWYTLTAGLRSVYTLEFVTRTVFNHLRVFAEICICICIRAHEKKSNKMVDSIWLYLYSKAEFIQSGKCKQLTFGHLMIFLYQFIFCK